MKRTLCLLLAIIMILSSTAALAQPSITNHLLQGFIDVFVGTTETIFSVNGNGSGFNWSINRTENGVTAPATITDDDPTPVAGTGGVGISDIGWDYWYNGDYTGGDGGVNHQLVVTGDDGSVQTVDFYVNYFHGEEFDRVSTESWLNPDELYPTEPVEEEFINPYTETHGKTYSHNTVCSFGPHFRNISPELTDKWYMFTALDLSYDGTQTYEIVGGNAYIIGSVTIDVYGDNVTVTYDYAPGVWGYDEFFTFFHDYDDVTTVNPSEISDKYEYEKTYSIANDLGGDTSVLLFMCNTATFKSDNRALGYFYENIDERKSLRQAMLDMIGKVEVTEPYRAR